MTQHISVDENSIGLQPSLRAIARKCRSCELAKLMRLLANRRAISSDSSLDPSLTSTSSSSGLHAAATAWRQAGKYFDALRKR